MNATTPDGTPITFDADHITDTLAGIGATYHVAYNPSAAYGLEAGWYSLAPRQGMIAGFVATRHASQARAIAHVANRVLADVSAETGDPQEILEVRSADEWFGPKPPHRKVVQVTVFGDDHQVLGWISHADCENPRCRVEIAEGRPWHATPADGTFEQNHYASADDAFDAFEAARS